MKNIDVAGEKFVSDVSPSMMKNLVDRIADEIASKIYYKMLLLTALPEIKLIERGKTKTLEGEEIIKALE